MTGDVLIEVGVGDHRGARERDSGSRHRAGEDPLGADLRDAPRSLHRLLRTQPRDRAGRSRSARRWASSPRSRSASPERSSRCVPSTTAVRRRGCRSSRSTRPRTPARCASSTSPTVDAKTGDLIVVNRNGKLLITDSKGREKERYALAYGSRLHVQDGQEVETGTELVEWDPFTSSILSEIGGTIEFRDIAEGENVREETDKVTGLSQRIIVEASASEKRIPAIVVKGAGEPSGATSCRRDRT